MCVIIIFTLYLSRVIHCVFCFCFSIKEPIINLIGFFVYICLMKKTIMILATLLTFTVSAQNDSLTVIKTIDEMTGKVSYSTSYQLLFTDAENVKGFSVNAFIDEKKTLASIMIRSAGLGNCNENDEVIILFDNGDKIIKKSWNKFNCDGNSWFFVSNIQKEMLSNQTIDKIRITNGYTFQDYTVTLKGSEKRYFIQLFKAIEE